MKWTNEEENTLIELLKNNMTYEDISIILNRTKTSVKNKSNKLGYKANSFSKSMKKCLYCDKDFEYNIKNKKDCVKKFCSSYCSLTYLNSNKESKKIECLNCNNTIHKFGKKFCSIDCSNTYKKKYNLNKIENGDTSLTTNSYKKYLIEKNGECCSRCGWSEVNPYSGNIPIELEHIDGNSDNNNLDNLELLCPNCHSLTKTYKGLNRGNGRHKRRQRYKQKKSY